MPTRPRVPQLIKYITASIATGGISLKAARETKTHQRGIRSRLCVFASFASSREGSEHKVLVSQGLRCQS